MSAVVSSTATLELAGVVSAFSSNISAAHRVDVTNNSTAAAGLLISGKNQQVGGIGGTGITSVAAGGSLTANHIIQTALIISGTAGSPGLVTVDASDASGNPLTEIGVGGSGVGAGGLSSNTFSGAILTGTAADGGMPSSNSSAVPEPSTVILLALAIVGLVSGTHWQRKHAPLRQIENRSDDC